MPESPAPAATPPPAPPITPPTAAPATDPWVARLLADMGKVVEDGNVVDLAPEPPAPAPDNVIKGEFVSMGEAARFKKEREEAAKAAPPKKEGDQAPPAQPKPGESPAAPAPADPAATPAPAPAAPPKKIEVVKAKPVEEIVEGVVRKLQREAQPPTPPPEPKVEPSKADPDAAFIETLGDEQKEEVELAQFAAKAQPDKYGTMPARMIKYLKDVDAFIDAKRKEDSEWDPDGDATFEAFIEENRPTYQTGDRRKLERQWIKTDVMAEVDAKMAPKIQEAEHAAHVQEIKPEIDKASDSYKVNVAQRIAGDDKSPFQAVMKAAQEKGLTEEAWAEAAKVDPLAASVAKYAMTQATALGREYLELFSGVSKQVPYDPKQTVDSPHNQRALRQQNLFQFVDNQEQHFAQNGGDLRVVNGRTFLPRAELAKLPDAEKAKHWTLSHDDVLDMLSGAAAGHAQVVLNTEIQRRTAEGYVRPAPGTAPKTETPDPNPTSTAAKAGESPKASASMQPGAANLAPPTQGRTGFSEAELKRHFQEGSSRWL